MRFFVFWIFLFIGVARAAGPQAAGAGGATALPAPLPTPPSAPSSAGPSLTPPSSALPPPTAALTLPPVPTTTTTSRLAKWEPQSGCYIGAFIEREPTLHGDINIFEALTKKKHASYFTYVGYKQPFPSEWVEGIKASKASPHIAFEPNNGLLEVQDDEYLRQWARDAAKAQCPIFLRWASEMNGPWTKYSGNPALYREKFALVSKVMKEEAPNVAMLWTPFSDPQHLIDVYYPGDEWVDWVGVNVYSVYVHNGDPKQIAYNKNPVEALRFVYDRYALRKPIHISEYAATIQCKGTGKETVDFAIEKMTQFYTALTREFPRVKSVNWFCLDTIRAGLANNNYSLVDDSRVLETYIKLVSNEHFLSYVEDNSDPRLTALAPATEYRRTIASLPKTPPIKPATPDKPPVVPVKPPKAPITVAKVDDDLLASKGVVATAIDEPWLRGLKPGEVLTGDASLRAQMPMGVEPRFILWQIDGGTAALTNSAPYRHTVDRDTLRLRYGPGRHVARLLVITSTGKELQSPEVEFFVAE